jgi:carbon storage regulator
MLVLSRKLGEKLLIGDDITVSVTFIKGNRVKLGIEAPPHVRVVRGELKPLADDAPRQEPNLTFSLMAEHAPSHAY